MTTTKTNSSQAENPTDAEKPKKAFTGRNFGDMVRKKKFTVRELNEHLRMATSTIKESEKDPSRLDLGTIFRLADLIDEPVEKLMGELVSQIKSLPEKEQPQNRMEPRRIRGVRKNQKAAADGMTDGESSSAPAGRVAKGKASKDTVE